MRQPCKACLSRPASFFLTPHWRKTCAQVKTAAICPWRRRPLAVFQVPARRGQTSRRHTPERIENDSARALLHRCHLVATLPYPAPSPTPEMTALLAGTGKNRHAGNSNRRNLRRSSRDGDQRHAPFRAQDGNFVICCFFLAFGLWEWLAADGRWYAAGGSFFVRSLRRSLPAACCNRLSANRFSASASPQCPFRVCPSGPAVTRSARARETKRFARSRTIAGSRPADLHPATRGAGVGVAMRELEQAARHFDLVLRLSLMIAIDRTGDRRTGRRAGGTVAVH